MHPSSVPSWRRRARRGHARPGDRSHAPEKRLAAEARKEGAVTIINPLFSDETAKRLGEAFVRRYELGPDFKFNNLRKGTGPTVAHVRQEIQAGRFTVLDTIYRGSFLECQVRVGPHEVIVQTDHDERLGPGQKVFLSFEPAHGLCLT